MYLVQMVGLIIVIVDSVINSDVNLTGYLNVGSAGPPLNVTAGDTTTKRLFVGTPIAPTTGDLVRIEGITTVSTDFIQVEGTGALASGGGITGYRGNIYSTGTTSAIGNFTGYIGGVFHTVPQNVTNQIGATTVCITEAGFSSGNITNQFGFQATVTHAGAGTITTSRGFMADLQVTGSGTITRYIGFDCSTLNTAVATTLAAFRFSGVSGAVNNFGIWSNTNTTGTGSGIVFGTGGDTSFWRGASNQLLTQGDWMSRHYLCSSTPTVAAGAGAGTGPTISITGTDHGFTVNLTTGTTATTNATLFTVTFGAAWTTSAPAVIYAPGNAATAALAVGATPFTSAVATTNMTFTSNATALADSTAYIFRFAANR